MGAVEGTVRAASGSIHMMPAGAPRPCGCHDARSSTPSCLHLCYLVRLCLPQIYKLQWDCRAAQHKAQGLASGNLTWEVSLCIFFF